MSSTLKFRLISCLLLLLLFGRVISAQTLDVVLELALDGNLQLLNQEYNRAIAELRLANAEAAFWPTVDLQGSFSILTNPPDGVSLPPGTLGTTAVPGSLFPTPVPDSEIVLVPDPENTFMQLRASISQAVYTSGKLGLARDIARLQVDDARLSEEARKSELSRDVRSSWAALRMLNTSLETATRMTEIYRNIVADNEVRFSQGLVNNQTVLEARFRLAGMIRSETEIRESLESTRQALEAVAGINFSFLDPVFSPSNLELVNSDIPGDTTAYDSLKINTSGEAELLVLLLEDNPALLQQGITTRIAELNRRINQASANFLPDIGVSIDIEISGQRLPLTPNWGETWDTSATISLGASTTAYDHGTAQNEIGIADYQLQQSRAGDQLLRQGQEVTLRNLVQRNNLAVSSYAEAVAQDAFLSEQFRNAQVSFDNGLITREDLLGSELLLLGARLGSAVQVLEYETVQAEIDYLLGRW